MRSAYFIINILYKLGFVKLGNYVGRYMKNTYGVFNTFVGRKSQSYDENWWDDRFYTSEIRDSKTISESIDKFSSHYHYSSVELLISKVFFERVKSIKFENVLDLGSGSGHWIKFYKSLGAKNISGVDVSEKAINYLTKEFYGDESIEFKRGQAHLVIENFERKFDLVNAIGIMFHIIDDNNWRATLSKISENMNSGGYLVVGGYFGLINGVNVQIDDRGVNKRLRSRSVWKETLNELGFEDVKFIKNKAAYEIPRALPENNILIAKKKKNV